MPHNLSQRVNLSALFSRSLLVLLILTIGGWTLLISPPKTATPWVIGLVQTLPLILFLPAVWKGHARSHAWLCFLVLLYFMVGVLDVTTPGRELLGGLKIVITLGLFTSAMLFARWKSQLQKSQQ